MSAASACAPLSPVHSSRVRTRVCSEAASFSAASACAPLSPKEFRRRLRDLQRCKRLCPTLSRSIVKSKDEGVRCGGILRRCKRLCPTVSDRISTKIEGQGMQ